MVSKALRLVVLVTIALSVVLIAPSGDPATANPADFSFANVIYSSCKTGDYPQYSFRYSVGPAELIVHEWILTNTDTGAVSGPLFFGYLAPGNYHVIPPHVGLNPIPPGTHPGDMMRQKVRVLDGLNNGAVIATDEILFKCDTGEGLAVPGCDALIQFPPGSTGGTFLADAPLFWAPGELVAPMTTVETGQSAIVTGVDETGEYYQILWGCQFLYVPISMIGPNCDDVWRCAPLPTGEVEPQPLAPAPAPAATGGGGGVTYTPVRGWQPPPPPP